MKHFLRTLFLLTLVGYSYFAQAQTGSCSVTELVIQNVRLVQGTTCTYEFDAAFTISSNSSKYIYFQTYAEAPNVSNNPSPYPNFWGCQNGTTTRNGAQRAPRGNEVGSPLLNVLIDNSGATPVLSTTYLPDPTVPILGPVTGVSRVETFTLPNDLTRFNLFNLRVTLPTELCTQPFVAITDFFATNANNPDVIQCVSCGVRFAVGFYTITSAVANCSTLQYTINVRNNTNATVGGNYQIYADVNGNQIYTPGVDVLISPASTSFSIAGGTTISLTGAIPAQYGGFDLFLFTTLTTGFANGASSIQLIPASPCAALPVKFKSFTANRKNADVQLTWETATEDNNKGFYVQRNNGSGWKDLDFVASKASDGNSTSDLTYNFTDLNNTSKGVTQYRIMQVDIDGKAKLSEVRQVRGLAQTGKVTVYPNPSSDGKVNVVFEDSKTAWNVSVSDMNGRTIKQFKAVSNSVLVDNLPPGMYMIRIVDIQTGAQSNEKVIVNNR